MAFNCLLSGPTGSGKSWALVHLCRAVGGQGLIIDAERSTRAYRPGGGFEYPTHGGVEMSYVPSVLEAHEIIKEQLARPVLPSGKATKLICVDGLTPLWQELQHQVDAYKRGKTHKPIFETGMSMDAWNVVNRLWKSFIEDLRRLEVPLVCTTWEKDEWSGVGDNRVLVGKKPDCQKNIQYEFDLVLFLDEFRGQSSAMVHKSRYHEKFPQGLPITSNLYEVIPQAFPQTFKGDEQQADPAARPTKEQAEKFDYLVSAHDLSHAQLRGGFHKYGVSRFEDLRPEDAGPFLLALVQWCAKQAASKPETKGVAL